MKKKFLSLIILCLTVLFLNCFVSLANNKKGVLYVDDVNDVIDLGCGQVAINYTLGLGTNITKSDIEKMRNEGIKVTFIVTSKIKTSANNTSGNPAPYNNPHFYMIDMNNSKVKSAFNDFVKDWANLGDNFVIGNEVSDQSYNYYKPAYAEEYIKKYCDSFKIIYKQIKAKKSNAKLFISFDQSWDMPALNKNATGYDANLSRFKYNSKELLTLINKELDKSMDWGVAAHPYPDPVTSPVFWDDHYAGHSEVGKEPEKAFVVTMNNFEILLNFINQADFHTASGDARDVLISEIAFSSSEGEEMQAAAFAYAFEKIKNNDQVIGFLYNAQRDTGDGYAFGLKTAGGSERQIRDIFKNIDTDDSEALDLMSRVIPGSENAIGTEGTEQVWSGGSYDAIKNKSVDELMQEANAYEQQKEQESAANAVVETTQVVTNNAYNSIKDVTTGDSYANITIASTNDYSYYYEVNDEIKVKFSFKIPVFVGSNQTEIDTLNNIMQTEGKQQVDQYLTDYADSLDEYPKSVSLTECHIKNLNADNLSIRYEGKDSNNGTVRFDLYYSRQDSSMWTD